VRAYTVRLYVSGTRRIPVIIASEHKRDPTLSARGSEEARLEETRFIERKFVNQGRAAPLYDQSFQAGRSIGLIQRRNNRFVQLVIRRARSRDNSSDASLGRVLNLVICPRPAVIVIEGDPQL